VCDFPVGVTLVISQDNGLALQFRETAETSSDLLTFQPAGHNFGDFVECRHAPGAGRSGIAFGAGLRGADSVHGFAVRDRHRPGQDGTALGAVARGGTPEFQEDFLGYFLRLRRVSQDSLHQPENRGGQVPVQLFEGHVVATGHARQQLIQSRLGPRGLP
jgi:hypothetical protein